MPTDFPFIADWDSKKPVLSLQVPANVASSKLLKEQRTTTFGEGEVRRRLDVTYLETGPNVGSIKNTLIQGKGGTFFVPFAPEPVTVALDFTGGGVSSFWSGSDHTFVGGPSWWQTERILRPTEELSGATGTFTKTEKVIRINIATTTFQVRQLVSWDFDFLGLGILGYTIDTPWSGVAVPRNKVQYFHMDEMMLVSAKERPITDSVIYYDITWESVR